MTKFSGRVMGAHQQLDRIARRHLKPLLADDTAFPKISEILRFEGKNGPDGIKIKSPARNEPWHFLNPLDPGDVNYLSVIDLHYQSLVNAIVSGNRERAAFEAAWLAHAVVDGLTPAHHFPYEARIEELRGGRSRQSRTTYSEKLIFKGDTTVETIGKLYRVYGPKGLFTAHHLFEFGVMLLLRPLRLADAKPTPKDLAEVVSKGPHEYFLHAAREVAVLGLYESYLAKGWTAALANRIRHRLAPRIVKTVTLLWYSASRDVGLCVP